MAVQPVVFMKLLVLRGRFVLFLLVCPGLSRPVFAQKSVPRPDHVVIVMEENLTLSRVLTAPSLGYIHSLIDQGALFISSFALTHPSEPNYLALFSGSMQGVSDDSCPHTFSAPNLGSQLLAAGMSFAGYSESLPYAGSSTCESGGYVRRHCPWVNFSNLPRSANLPFSSFPANFNELPTVCFVIPTLQHDLHSGSGADADNWLLRHLGHYVEWAATNNSLLIISWDEGDRVNNQIATILVGPMVQPGRYGERITHYTVLRTLEEMYGLAPLGGAARAEPITSSWTPDSIQPPVTVELSSPIDGWRLRAPTNIELVATASASGSAVRSVEFFQRTKKLGEATNSPFAFTWTNPPPGDYFLVAHAIDELGRTKWSRSVEVRVAAPLNPFPAVQGNYSGLFYETNEVRAASSGRITVTTTGRGTYSGALQWSGRRRSFSGSLDLSGHATDRLTGPLTNVLTLELALDLSNPASRLTGRLVDAAWVAELQADRAVFDSTTHRAPWANHYTMALPDDETPMSPAGDGVGSVTLKVGGGVRLAGTLADGTPLTQAANISGDGDWPLFAPLYAGRGSLLGWLRFTNGLAPGFGGRVSWIKPSLAAATFYPGGFTNESAAVGSVYHPPAGFGAGVVTFSNGQILFSEGNQAATFTNLVSFGANNRITNLSSNGLTLAFHPATGRLSGFVIEPSNGHRLFLTGTVLQNQDIAVGFCLGTNLSGSVLLQPR
jgi:hypothetical protein